METGERPTRPEYIRGPCPDLQPQTFLGCFLRHCLQPSHLKKLLCCGLIFVTTTPLYLTQLL